VKRFLLGRNKFSNEPSSLTVTVVVPAWNEQDFIGETIEHLLKSEYPIDIIVVDDNSTDRTGEIARSYGVRVLRPDTNQGSKSQALNYAIPHVTTDLFICVDADTLILPQSVGQLVKAFNNENVMVASGFVESRAKKNFWQMGRYGEYILGQYVNKSAQENMNVVLVASGCFFAIRTDFLREHTFQARSLAEDMDLTWTAVESGYDVAFVTDAPCVVNDPLTWSVYRKQVNRWFSGFFQCVRVRNGNLFRAPRLGITAYTYMVVNLIGTPSLVVLSALGLIYNPALVGIGFGMAYGALLLAAFFYAVQTRRNPVMYPIYVFCMMVVGVINYYLYVTAAYREFFTKNRLETWEKGH